MVIEIKEKFKINSVEGVGTNDVDFSNYQHVKAFFNWRDMLKRCYNSKFQEKHPTYIGCSVSDDWLLFSNFLKWYYENYVKDYELDKDLLVKNNKIYSKEACCFLPVAINSTLANVQSRNTSGAIGVGWDKRANKYQCRIRKFGKRYYLGLFTDINQDAQAYNLARSEYLVELADLYKNEITQKVYNALINLSKIDVNNVQVT